MPRSSISRSASEPVRSALTVRAGALITSASGVSGPAPSATTRVRMSWSVTIPRSSPSSTTTHVAPAATMRAAASCTGVPGSQTSGGARISSASGRSAALGGGPGSGPASSGAESDRATNRSAAGRSSTGRIASSGMR